MASSSRSARESSDGPNMIALVELHRAVENERVQAHRLDDVEDLARAPHGRGVLVREPSRGRVDLDLLDVRHEPQPCIWTQGMQ